MPALEDRVALVTGSSRGIGAAIARLFAREGARVALHGRDAAALAAVRAGIERDGGRAMAVTGDVTRWADVVALCDRVEQELGPIDILVANAGGSRTRPGLPIEEVSEEGWRASLDLNVTATFLCLKAVLPSMKRRGTGNIITISSAAARRPSPHSPMPYAVAKAAVELLTQDVAAQVGPSGIRVNCIAPETILTEDNQRDIPDATKAQLVASHPIRRLGTPDDVAHAALYLASDGAGWVSGVVLDVAGGSVLVR